MTNRSGVTQKQSGFIGVEKEDGFFTNTNVKRFGVQEQLLNKEKNYIDVDGRNSTYIHRATTDLE